VAVVGGKALDAQGDGVTAGGGAEATHEQPGEAQVIAVVGVVVVAEEEALVVVLVAEEMANAEEIVAAIVGIVVVGVDEAGDVEVGKAIKRNGLL